MVATLTLFTVLNSSPVFANGQTTHLWITDTAVTHVTEESLKALLTTERNSLRVGTMFPDGGYAIGHPYSEVAHWEPFQDRFRDWILDSFDNPSSPEAAPYVAFYFGLASHGMADQVFDSMYMERSKAYDADLGWSESSESLDTSQDVVFADLTGPQSVPDMAIPDVLPELFSEAGVEVDMGTLEDGQGWLEVAVDGVGGMSEVSTLVDSHIDAFPWGCSHLLDDSIPGAPPFEARVVAKYWESLWADLHGDPLPLAIIGSWPIDQAEGFSIGPEDVEARLSVVFNRSLFDADVSNDHFGVTAPESPVPITLDLFYGNDSHVVNVSPDLGWQPDAIHTFTVDGMIATDGRSQQEPFELEFNTGQYPTESDDTSKGCACAHARAPSWMWAWLVPMVCVVRRR